MYISDLNSDKYPISIKGILFVNNKLVLLKNERDEWELPGGKIEKKETPELCVIREIKEELNLVVQTEKLVDVWIYNILNKVDVFIVTYLCKPLHININEVQISHEHKEVRFFELADLKNINMPTGYKDSIKKALNY